MKQSDISELVILFGMGIIIAMLVIMLLWIAFFYEDSSNTIRVNCRYEPQWTYMGDHYPGNVGGYAIMTVEVCDTVTITPEVK